MALTQLIWLKMGKRDFSDACDAFTRIAFGVDGGVPDSIGGDAGGVICNELDE